jgi:hypothetical protein
MLAPNPSRDISSRRHVVPVLVRDKVLDAHPVANTSCVAIEQGIFATNTEVISEPPQIRDGMYGAPFASTAKVARFFRYADIKGYSTDQLTDDECALVVEFLVNLLGYVNCSPPTSS